MSYFCATTGRVVEGVLCLCILISASVSQADTAVCDQQFTQKLCLQIERSPNNERFWLWISPSCPESCQLTHSEFNSVFRFIENLPAKEFGMELHNTEQGETFWTGYSMDKERPFIPATIMFPVSRSEYLNLTDNRIEPGLLKDLARLKPNWKELLRRHQQIQAETDWGRTLLTHLITAVIPIFILYCCHQCGL